MNNRNTDYYYSADQVHTKIHRSLNNSIITLWTTKILENFSLKVYNLGLDESIFIIKPMVNANSHEYVFKN